MAKQRVGIEFEGLHRPLGNSAPAEVSVYGVEGIPRKVKLEPYMIRISAQALTDCREMIARMGDGVSLQELLRHAIDLGLQQLKEKAGK